MTEVCAAMGLSNLDVLDEVFATNRRNHSSYKNAFSGMKSLSLIDYPEKETNSHHYIVMEVDEGFSTSRDRIISSLHAENVLARKYFWPGCHKMKPYRELFPHSDLMLKSTEKLSERVIVLPNGNDLNETGIEIIRDIFSVLA
jgi:dTDP-4-amino-4,6-dideoxygalactose transaminase